MQDIYQLIQTLCSFGMLIVSLIALVVTITKKK